MMWLANRTVRGPARSVDQIWREAWQLVHAFYIDVEHGQEESEDHPGVTDDDPHFQFKKVTLSSQYTVSAPTWLSVHRMWLI